jgi:hypothetical protein
MQFWPSQRPVNRPKTYMVSRTMARALETGRWSNDPYLRILEDVIYPALGIEWVGVGCRWIRLPNVQSAGTDTSEDLLAEGQCVLTLNRSSTGRVKFEMRTHVMGAIHMEMDSAAFADLVFGLVEVPAKISRVLAARKPASYPANVKLAQKEDEENH